MKDLVILSHITNKGERWREWFIQLAYFAQVSQEAFIHLCCCVEPAQNTLRETRSDLHGFCTNFIV